jgi:hypothetical protein
MSWQTMSAEISGQCPVDYLFAKTLVNRAWLNVQRKHIWSFLWGKRAIPTPNPTAAGTVTLASGSPLVIGDATASPAWAAIPGANPITVQQFRVGTGTIYNIVGVAINTPSAGLTTLTLDNPYVDPQFGAGISYTISQFYYSAPVADFLWWESIIDPVSGYAMRCTLTNEEVDRKDPQRFQSGWPVGPIPYLVNPNVASPFYQWPMYELWPEPLNNYTYVGSFFRRGSLFVNDTDQVNAMLGEDLVIALAKVYAYEWAIANKDMPVAQKKSWQFTLGYAKKEYDGLLSDYMIKDEEFSHRHVINSSEDAYIEALPWISQREGLGYFPD